MAHDAMSTQRFGFPPGIMGKPRAPQRFSANNTSVMTAQSLQPKMP
eukprot:CAMPEP_0172799892 /NCGR_PEP_ID=MMETSP1075-20121228/2182_1 /TAXON_ID=2916 /ORGANISM="Ceratium fusus, Strain PA161109" /LENGTH=45 /DNA_ID= /DNA_START= /DNA_END= /DNA_ORIENTATION=